MKKKLVVAAFVMIASFANAQVKVKNTSFGLNLGGAVSVFFEDSTVLALKDNQVREIDDYRRRYEKEYNTWSGGKKHSDYEIRNKREQMVRSIRIEVENVLTVNQREEWYSYDDRYNRNEHYHHDHKSNKKKQKHKNKHGKGHGHGHHCD